MSRGWQVVLLGYLVLLGISAHGVEVINAGDTFLVPARPVADWLGATLDDSGNTISLRLGNASVRFSLGGTLALINNKTVTLDESPVKNGDTVYVPVSLLRRAFGVRYTENPAQASIVLTTPQQQSPLRLITPLAGTPLQNTFLNAVRANNLATVKTMLAETPELLIAPDQAQRTPLQQAVQRGRLEMTQYLIEQGADLTTKFYNEHYTLLHFAAQSGQLEIARILVEKGMDINATTTSGYTPLLQACTNRNVAMAQWFIDHGAQVNVTLTNRANPQLDEPGERARWLLGQTEVALSPGLSGSTPLIIATIYKNLPLAQLLVEHGADLSVTYTDEQLTLLHLATLAGSPDLVAFYVAKGMKVNATSTFGFTPLYCACLMNNADLAAWLLEHGAEASLAAEIPTEILDASVQPVALLPLFASPHMQAMLGENDTIEHLLQTHGVQAATPDQREQVRKVFPSVVQRNQRNGCIERLRAIGAACLALARKNGNRLPAADVWQTLNLPQPRLACPGMPNTANGYGYNTKLAGKQANRIPNRNRIILFAECKSADALIRTADDIDQQRHDGGFVAVFCDGHVEYVKAGTAITLE